MIRLALEVTLDRYWARVLPAAATVGMRQQLLLLPLYASDEAAALAREAWLGLAGAAHHHAYELAPTAGELRGWWVAVRRLGELVASPVLHRTGSSCADQPTELTAECRSGVAP